MPSKDLYFLMVVALSQLKTVMIFIMIQVNFTIEGWIFYSGTGKRPTDDVAPDNGMEHPGVAGSLAWDVWLSNDTNGFLYFLLQAQELMLF